MEPLGDDQIFCIFNKLIEGQDYRERKELIKSFSKVSKQFLKVACFRLYKLHNSLPDMLYDILPLSPNLSYFSSSKPLSNAHMKLLAKSCPNLLDIRLYDPNPRGQVVEFDDFDDEGLCAVADNCRELLEIELVGRSRVTDKGVVYFVRSGVFGHLELTKCAGVTDESLKVIGEASFPELGLQGCHITDLGLEYLMNGELKNWLEVLNLTGCDNISDTGIMKMTQMHYLRTLDLSGCGVGITDTGIVALSSQIPNIEMLFLPWLINITDASLNAIASNCLKLQVLYLNGCEAITRDGLLAFAGNPRLYELVLFSCHGLSWEDVESVVSACRSLKSISLSRILTTPIPEAIGDVIGHCRIVWEEE